MAYVPKLGLARGACSLSALIYAAADYDLLELRCLAQVCLVLVGESKLAEALNAGVDVHLQMAASILGISYEDAKARKKAGDKEIDNARQTAKVANFGFPGGLGAEKLVLFARKSYKVTLTVERAKELKELWLQTWPEMRRYFKLISGMIGPEGSTIRQLFTKRIRGGANYTSTCNTFFQGLGADATGRAVFLVSRACYVPGSVLYGCRLVNYIHDELILECAEEIGHEVAPELVRIMVAGANEFLPDVPATAEPKLMRYWSKDAKQVWDNGRLVAWPKA